MSYFVLQLAKATASPRKVLTGAIAQVKRTYKALKNRYGPRYTKAMLIAAFIALFVPIESFDPAANCFRPKALRELSAILELLRTECVAPCPDLPAEDEDVPGAAP